MAAPADADWRERALRAEASLQEAQAERARLWEELNRLRAERREVEYFERLARQMEGSVSWQLTAPLRVGKGLAARVRRKLDERER
jgi:predicted nuclease with TOPRIM domain